MCDAISVACIEETARASPVVYPSFGGVGEFSSV